MIDEKHAYAFGYSYDSDSVKSMKIVEYDFTFKKLYEINSELPPPLWKLISDYVVTHPKYVTYEIWDDIYVMHCNWYGEYTFGTCWVRGCKIWLTPKAGTTFFIDSNYDPIDNFADYCESAIETQYEQHQKDLSHDPNRYNTNYLPFRTARPTELFDVLTSKGPVYNIRSVDNRIISRDILNSYKELGKLNNNTFIYLDPSGEHNGDSMEGGVAVAIIYNISAINEELKWIQEIGINDHDISFEWI